MSDTVISDHPDWFNPEIPDENRAAAIELDFEKRFNNDKKYQNSDPETQGLYRDAHKQLIEEAAYKSEHNPSNKRDVANQEAADNSGFLANTFAKGANSLKAGAALRGIVDDAINPDGTVDRNAGELFSKYYQKQKEQIVTRGEKKIGAAFNKAQKKAEADGFVNDALAYGEFILDGVLTNPKGIVQLGADSLSSYAVMGMGAWGGGKTGGVIGGAVGGAPGAAIGSAVGAPVGMAAATTSLSGAMKSAELIKKELTDRDIVPTGPNIQDFMDENPELIKEIQKKAVTYGGSMGILDTVTGGAVSRVSSLSTRAARKAAMHSIDDASKAAIEEVAKATGKSAKDLTEDVINGEAKKLLKGRSFKKKLGDKAISVGGEVASEPISEAGATAAIGEEITAEDLIYETLGGIGMGPVGASINTAAMGSKLGANKTGEFTKKVMNSTPESRAENKELKAQKKAEKVKTKDTAKQAKEQSQSEAAYKFKETVAETDPKDAVVGEYADPDNDNYDPIKAAAILSKADDVDSLDKIKEVETAVKNDLLATMDRSDELMAKRESGKLTPQEGEELKGMAATLDYKEATFKKLKTFSSQSNNKVNDSGKKAEITPINPDTANSEEVVDSITDSFGSHGNQNAINTEQIDTLLKREDLSDSDRSILTAKKEADQARSDIQVPKSMKEVSNDIYAGQSGSDFKGIDAYKMGIRNNLNKNVNNVEAATKHLDGLKKFRDTHQLKSDRMTEVFNAKVAGKELTPKQEKIYADLKKEYRRTSGKPMDIHAKSGSFVAAVQSEAAALNKEVALAESLFKARGFQIGTNAPSKGKKSAETAPAAPVSKPQSYDYSQRTRGSLQGLIARGEKATEKGTITKEQTEKLNAAKAEIGKRDQHNQKLKEEIDGIEATQESIDAFQASLDKGTLPSGTALTESQQKRLDDVLTEKRKELAKATEPGTENKETGTSTDTGNTANVVNEVTDSDTDSDADAAPEYIDPSEMTVEFTDTDGSVVTKPFSEAIAEINTEIQETQSIIDCINS